MEDARRYDDITDQDERRADDIGPVVHASTSIDPPWHGSSSRQIKPPMNIITTVVVRSGDVNEQTRLVVRWQ
jgi:hypothetical protein